MHIISPAPAFLPQGRTLASVQASSTPRFGMEAPNPLRQFAEIADRFGPAIKDRTENRNGKPIDSIRYQNAQGFTPEMRALALAAHIKYRQGRHDEVTPQEKEAHRNRNKLNKEADNVKLVAYRMINGFTPEDEGLVRSAERKISITSEPLLPEEKEACKKKRRLDNQYKAEQD